MVICYLSIGEAEDYRYYWQADWDKEKLELAECKNTRYRKLLDGLTPAAILPGVRDSLDTLHRKGIKLAIGSSSRITSYNVCYTKLLRNLLKLDQGAQIVDLSDYKMPPCIILRSDGATLYATRDIAAALYRKDTRNNFV